MPLRLIEMLVPEEKSENAEEILEDNELALDFWTDRVSDGNVSFNIIVRAEKSQNLVDELSENFSGFECFKLLLTSLEAVVPHPEEEEKEEWEKSEEEKTESPSITREELYSNLTDRCKISGAYIGLISLSAVVAAIGVLRNDIAVIVGAMVIAPLVGPNMGLSLATTLAEPELGRKALKTIGAGIAMAFFISFLIGIFLDVNPNLGFIYSRTEAGIADVALALASGSAGALAFTRDVSTALVGVMVSIALLPTLVASGLLMGSSYLFMGGEAAALFLINLICINLSGVVTFRIEGILPKDWWQADKAKKMSRTALIVWIVLLSILTVMIYYL